jgi:hypothetical protein
VAILFQIEGTTNQGVLLRDAICDAYNYQPFLPDENGELTIPNPETKNHFSRRMILEFLKDIVRSYRVKEIETTRLLKIEQAETEVSGILIN